MNFAAPENTAKAPPFETGATIRAPTKEDDMQRNMMMTGYFIERRRFK
jgi:hypothetical protein